MSRRSESLSYILVHDLPWWVSVIVAGAVYGLLREIAPHLMQDNKLVAPIMQAAPQVAGFAALFFLMLAVLSFWRQLLQGMTGRRKAKAQASRTPEGTMAKTPTCPSCHTPMVIRVAKQGARAGSQFWGCSHYPGCKGIHSL